MSKFNGLELADALSKNIGGETTNQLSAAELRRLVSFNKELHAEMLAKLAEQPAQQEPFGYFKAEPFGWTDCAETDEGAVALYTTPQAQPAQQEATQKVNGINNLHQESAMQKAAPQAQPAREPLTDDELADLWYKQSLDWMEFARAIEAAHGITKGNT